MAADEGPSAVTLREVARRAGVSQAAPYHHFEDKAALMAAVAEEGFRLFDAHQETAVREAPHDPVARLGALGISYLRFAIDYPHYFQVMFRPSLVTTTRPPDLERLAASAFNRLVETTAAARRASGRRDPDPFPAAVTMWAIPHGLAGLYLEQSAAAPMSRALLESIVVDASRALAAAPLSALARPGQPRRRPAAGL